MKIQVFEDILAWQKRKILTTYLYQLLRNNRDFSYKDQILRASLSIGSNIAEGYERRSNKEFKQFLFIAKGSAGEVRSLLYVGQELKYFNQEEYNKAYNLSLEIARMISGLIKVL